LGGGSSRAAKEFPNLEMDVVEIDPEVIQIAKTTSTCAKQEPPTPRQDGRLFHPHRTDTTSS
jgi:hypothetical protein